MSRSSIAEGISASEGSSSFAPTFTFGKHTAYVKELSRRYKALKHIVLEEPASPPRISTDEEDAEEQLRAHHDAQQERIAGLRGRIQDAWVTADGNPADSRWGVIPRLLRLGSTSCGRSLKQQRRFTGVRKDIRAPEPLEHLPWINAENEAEWKEWERRYNAERRVKDKVEHWQKGVEEDPEMLPPPGSASTAGQLDDVRPPPAKVSGAKKSKASVNSSAPKVRKNTKASAPGPSGDPLNSAAPLGFGVVKRSSQQSITGKPDAPAEVKSKSPDAQKTQQPAKKIYDMSTIPEITTLSFTSQLQTSTPAKNAKPSSSSTRAQPAKPHSTKPSATHPPTSPSKPLTAARKAEVQQALQETRVLETTTSLPVMPIPVKKPVPPLRHKPVSTAAPLPSNSVNANNKRVLEHAPEPEISKGSEAASVDKAETVDADGRALKRARTEESIGASQAPAASAAVEVQVAAAIPSPPRTPPRNIPETRLFGVAGASVETISGPSLQPHPQPVPRLNLAVMSSTTLESGSLRVGGVPRTPQKERKKTPLPKSPQHQSSRATPQPQPQPQANTARPQTPQLRTPPQKAPAQIAAQDGKSLPTLTELLASAKKPKRKRSVFAVSVSVQKEASSSSSATAPQAAAAPSQTEERGRREVAKEPGEEQHQPASGQSNTNSNPFFDPFSIHNHDEAVQKELQDHLNAELVLPGAETTTASKPSSRAQGHVSEISQGKEAQQRMFGVAQIDADGPMGIGAVFEPDTFADGEDEDDRISIDVDEAALARSLALASPTKSFSSIADSDEENDDEEDELREDGAREEEEEEEEVYVEEQQPSVDLAMLDTMNGDRMDVDLRIDSSFRPQATSTQVPPPEDTEKSLFDPPITSTQVPRAGVLGGGSNGSQGKRGPFMSRSNHAGGLELDTPASTPGGAGAERVSQEEPDSWASMYASTAANGNDSGGKRQSQPKSTPSSQPRTMPPPSSFPTHTPTKSGPASTPLAPVYNSQFVSAVAAKVDQVDKLLEKDVMVDTRYFEGNDASQSVKPPRVRRGLLDDSSDDESDEGGPSNNPLSRMGTGSGYSGYSGAGFGQNVIESFGSYGYGNAFDYKDGSG